ncbi:TPA: phosphohistidine phosphatase [Yersinia enterocolitica]|nr:phosphohistidine phosphatase [Yersinia enterocolitica]HDL6901513.1 phosphohistidine phosphatase [Yersinia enterocolitica]
MESFLEKISSYNIFNNLLPGAVFLFFFEKTIGYSIASDDVVKNIFLYYFTGLIIGRVGSIAIEPLLRKIVKFAEYDRFLKAATIDPKIDVLSEANNMYRTLFTMSFLLLMISLILFFINRTHGNVISICIYLFMCFLFIFSYVKQTNYIVMRVKKLVP